MIEERSIKDIYIRITQLEKDNIELTNMYNKLAKEFTRFTITTEERFRSQNANMHSEIRQQSHF